MGHKSIPLSEKFTLTTMEAAEYFNIGQKRMKLLAADNTDLFSVWIGNRYLIIRHRFEEYLLGNLKKNNTETENYRNVTSLEAHRNEKTGIGG